MITPKAVVLKPSSILKALGSFKIQMKPSSKQDNPGAQDKAGPFVFLTCSPDKFYTGLKTHWVKMCVAHSSIIGVRGNERVIVRGNEGTSYCVRPAGNHEFPGSWLR